MTRTTCWVATAVAVTMLLAQGPTAHGKASQCPAGPVTVEAVITQVDMTDNMGDTDYNFFLRPLGPGEQSAFPNVPGKSKLLDLFWEWPSHPDCKNTWVDYLVRKVKSHLAREFSDECRACAGPQTGCPGLWLGRSNPCPRFFSCKACLYDLQRLNRQLSNEPSDADNLSFYTPKAEIFIGANQECTSNTSRCNDRNSILMTAMFNLGVPFVGNCDLNPGTASEDVCVFCSELNWTGRNWVKPGFPPNGGVCGKHVLIRGVRTFDQSHDMRPEIHPISMMAVAWGGGDFSVGTFIDGSTNPPNPIGLFVENWHFNYRTSPRFGGAGLMPSIVRVDLSQLQARPPAGGWVSDCWHRQYLTHNVLNVFPTGSSACPTYEIRMDFNKPAGAAWTAWVHAGWKPGRSDLQVKTRLETPGGVLAAEPPQEGGYARGKSSCDVRVGAGQSATDLKRWYRWRVETTSSFPGYPADRVTWTWSRTPESIRFSPLPPQQVPQRPYSFAVWLPAPPHYSGVLGTTVRANGSPVAQRTERLQARQPTVYLTTGGSKVVPGGPWKYTVPPGVGGSYHHTARLLGREQAQRWPEMFPQKIYYSQVYQIPASWVPIVESRMPIPGVTPSYSVYKTSVTAAATGFCGDRSTWRYEWSRDGKPLGTSTPGPIEVTLRAGERQVYTVSVRDQWGVELAVDTRVVGSPPLSAQLQASCGDAPGSGAEVPFGLPSGWSQAGPSFTQRLCRRVEVAPATTDFGGVGAFFPPTKLTGLTYAWSDLRYASAATQGKWKPMPQAWLSTPRGRSTGTSTAPALTISPSPLQFIEFQGTVTVSDSQGRSAIANFARSNDFTPPQRFVKAVEWLWKAVRPGRRLPPPDRCPLCRGRAVKDPLEAEFKALLYWAKNTAPSDASAVQSFRTRLVRFRGETLASIGKQQHRLTLPRWERPQFSKRSARVSRKVVHARARVKAIRRLRSQPSLKKLLSRWASSPAAPRSSACKRGEVRHNGRCVRRCPRGYSAKSGKCVRLRRPLLRLPKLKCKRGQVLHGRRCVRRCPRGYLAKSGKCVRLRRPLLRLPKPQCKRGQVLHGGRCVRGCPRGYLAKSGKCVRVRRPLLRRPLLRRPTLKCKRGQVRYGGRCVSRCPRGYAALWGTCIKRPKAPTCRRGQVRLGRRCLRRCPRGYSVRSGTCVRALRLRRR